MFLFYFLSVLTVVNMYCCFNHFIEFVWPFSLGQVILNPFLKSVIEQVYKDFFVIVYLGLKLFKLGSVGVSRPPLFKVLDLLSCLSFLVNSSKHLANFFLKGSLVLKGAFSVVVASVKATVKLVFNYRLDLFSSLPFHACSCYKYLVLVYSSNTIKAAVKVHVAKECFQVFSVSILGLQCRHFAFCV